jgi:CRISPR-associated protein Csd1
MMSLMAALLETYNYALDRGLVDNYELSTNGLVLLPIYHSNKRASNNEDIFEITIDRNSNPVEGRFLNKDEIIVFPITENSIIRSGSKVAPHAISDELSYLANRIDEKKNEEYLKGVRDLLDYEEKFNYKNFRIIGEYITKNTILDDFLKFYFRNTEYHIDDKFNLKYEESGNDGKTKEKSLDLKKIFITFKLEKEFSGDITLTRDVGLHDFYINYVRRKNSSSNEVSYCDISGKLDYYVERHRGLIGNAKLISISNNDETYYGRLKDGKDIYHISYETSQKTHNMLKYLIDNSNHSRFIGENAYIINWLSQDLDKGGVKLLSEIDYEDIEDEGEKSADELGGEISDNLKKYFLGENSTFSGKRDFYVLIIEKISNGRISMKYFRRLSRSEAYQRVMDWYRSTSWQFYNYNSKKITERSPSLYEIVNFIYGQENSKGYLACENKKLFRSTIERLIPCVIDGQRLPRDISRTVFYRLSKKQSYKKSWNGALNIGCALIKKHKNDYEGYPFHDLLFHVTDA